MIKIAQLTKYGQLAASTRQRFDQYRPFLNSAGCVTESWALLEDRYLSTVYSGGGRDPAYILQRYLGRAQNLAFRNDVDLLWVHCEVFPYLPGMFDCLIRLPRKPIVFDYDDAIFHNYNLHKNPFIRALLGKKLKPILSASQVALCGNAYLAEYASKYCRSTHVIPTVLDTNIYLPPSQAFDRVHTSIGWIGTPSTWAAYMAPMMPDLMAIAMAGGGRLTAVGAGRAAEPHPLLDNVLWSEQSEVARIQEMDIGIMPLTDTPWARGKCGYKLIQYMACGLPVVASPVGVNAEIVEHGVNGFLATTPEEWRVALDTLLRDPDLRRRMGAEGRRKVEAHYSLHVWGPRVAKLLVDVAQGGGACFT